MAKMIATAAWKRGRGTLGALDPLLGTWTATADSPLGRVRCTRSFTRILGGRYVQLQAKWQMAGGDYEELAVYGPGARGQLVFWSFTSDGKRSEGRQADVSDLHPQAVGFEAEMPAGKARTAYWPDDAGCVCWVVEARTKKGWKRFTEHLYRRV
jgi:hypothetical protein